MIGDDPQEETKATNSGLIPVLAKNPRIQIVAILLSVLLALGGLITFLVVDSERKPADEYAGCVTSHETYNQTSEAPLGTYSRFAVAADNKLCSTVGRDILERGGSAVDAAIASGLCNSVMNAQSMGIGGGHFMVIYKKSENKSYIIDAREAAPLNSHKDMFVNDSQKALIGGLATAIPGEIYGYWKAYQIGGQLPWSELFEPTIRLCEEGYIVSKSLAGALREKQSLIKANSGLSEVFIDPNTGSVYKEGDTARRPKLANTFRILAQYGAEAFYNGVLTPLIVNEINKNGGNVSLRDFNIYEPRVHEDRFLIRLDSNLRLYTAPPPSSGILVPTVIRIMKKFQLDNFSSMTNSSWNLFYHRLAEAFKHVYSKRTYFGDEQFTDMTQILDELVSQSYIDEIAAKINDKKTYPTSYYGSARFWEDHGTAHISVIAPNGDAVSLTSTINNYFGGKYAGDDTGIIYCDIMDDFSTPGVVNSFGFVPSEANHIEPQKRPLSSMSPIIVVDNDDNVRLVLGSSGGSKIISSVAQVALRTLFLGMDIKSAIDERRIHHQLYPNNAQLEAGFPKFVTNHLKKIGHETTCFSFGGSTVQGIQVRDQRILAYSDPRKGGQPDGI